MDLEYPQETHAKRTILCPILKFTSETEEYQGKCKLVEDVLIFSGKCYTVDTIEQLPEKVAAIKSTQRIIGTTLAYFERLSPFSNFFPCKFEVSGQTYNSSEQWKQYKKAIFFGDQKTANEVMNSASPQEAKNLSGQISGHDKSIWSEQGLDLFRICIETKFAQNDLLLKILNETKPLIIVKATKDQ